MVWEIIFLLLILKIPVVYLACVVWWAIRAEPEPEEGAAVAVELGPDDPHPGWSRWRRALSPRPRRGGPHGSPRRRYARRASVLARERNTS
jgi:hypothetical protein